MSPTAASDSANGTEKSRTNCLLDLGVFAPLGLALTWRELIPQLAKAGRDQISMSRSLGRAAMQGVARSGQTPQTQKATSRSRRKAETFDRSDYGSRTARDVIATLQDCSDAEAAWIRSQEAAGKQRVTVLRALDQRG